MRFKLLTVLCALLLSAVGYGQQSVAGPPDAIFFNGKVVTVDAAFTTEQAFAVKGEAFVDVGTNERIRALAGSATRLVDLRGSSVIPGLTDNHNHLYDTAKLFLTGLDMDGVKSRTDVLGRLRQAVAAARPGQTVFTSVVRLPPGKAPPTRADLDQVAKDVPIVMLRGRRGAALYNTAALTRAGITREAATFEGAAMPKDASGDLTGANPPYPAGMKLLETLLPPLTDAEEEAFLLKAIDQRHALGLTSVRDLSLFPGAMRAYFRLWQKGRLPMRVSMALDLPDVTTLDDALRAWGVGSGFGDVWLRLDSISEDPYPPIVDVKQYTAVALSANRYGWRLAPHVGLDDGGLEAALEAFEAANRVSPIRDKRWIIEHAPGATPEQMDQMKRLGVIVSASIGGYGGNIAPNLDAAARARAERHTPMREFLDHGLVVSTGTDYLNALPDDSPFVAIYFYVTRKTRNGQVIGPHEKITRQEALRVSTMNYAYMTFEEKVKGSIEPGKLADFLILPDDILTVPEDEILTMRPLATYVGGRRCSQLREAAFEPGLDSMAFARPNSVAFTPQSGWTLVTAQRQPRTPRR